MLNKILISREQKRPGHSDTPGYPSQAQENNEYSQFFASLLTSLRATSSIPEIILSPFSHK